MKRSVILTGLGFILFSIVLHSCRKDEIPTLSTSIITNITASTASGGGNITSDGGAEVTARGVCWSVNENPTTSDSKTTDGGGKGQFVSNITGIDAGTTYHIRAYATNSAGTAYGTDLSFATLGEAPVCLTQPASDISTAGAILNGTVSANFLPTTVTFEYGTTANYGQAVTADQSPVTGKTITNVTAEITDLEEGTTYHFRVKAVNSLGTTYGDDMFFTTIMADADGNVYKTVTIGTQAWMAENLRTTKYQNGDLIPMVADSSRWRKLTAGAFYYYENEKKYIDTYGFLYNHYSVGDSQI